MLRPSSSNSELQSLRKRITDPEKARSRSPRRNSQKQNALAGAPAMLALPAPSAPGKDGGKGKNNKKRVKETINLVHRIISILF